MLGRRPSIILAKKGERVAEEMIQVAAVAVQIIQAIDRRADQP